MRLLFIVALGVSGCIASSSDDDTLCTSACDEITPDSQARVLIVDRTLDTFELSSDAAEVASFYNTNGLRTQTLPGMTPQKLLSFLERSRVTYARFVYVGHHGYDGPILHTDSVQRIRASEAGFSEWRVVSRNQIGLVTNADYLWNTRAADSVNITALNYLDRDADVVAIQNAFRTIPATVWTSIRSCIGSGPYPVFDGPEIENGDDHERVRRRAFWYLFSQASDDPARLLRPSCIAAREMARRYPVIGAMATTNVEREPFDRFMTLLRQRVAGSGTVVLHGCNAGTESPEALVREYRASSYAQLVSRETGLRTIAPNAQTSCTRALVDLRAVENHLAGRRAQPEQPLVVFEGGQQVATL